MSHASRAGRGSAATARTFYVAPTGSDSAAGTQAAPWASIAHAQAVAQPGETVYFRGGTYAIGLGNLRNDLAYGGTLTSNMSGTNAASNSWNLSVTLSDAQFQSVSTSGWDAPRQADGSLPFNGSAPDLGAFETP